MPKKPARRSSSPPPAPSAARLAIARLLILATVLGFGGVAWARTRGAAAAVDLATLNALWWAAVGAWLAGVGGVLVVRRAWGRSTLPAQRHRLTVVGWALAEIPALAGAIHLWMTGVPRLFSAGLFFLLLAFFLFSSPAEGR